MTLSAIWLKSSSAYVGIKLCLISAVCLTFIGIRRVFSDDEPARCASLNGDPYAQIVIFRLRQRSRRLRASAICSLFLILFVLGGSPGLFAFAGLLKSYNDRHALVNATSDISDDFFDDELRGMDEKKSGFDDC
jgi:hypothetical protein